MSANELEVEFADATEYKELQGSAKQRNYSIYKILFCVFAIAAAGIVFDSKLNMNDDPAGTSLSTEEQPIQQRFSCAF